MKWKLLKDFWGISNKYPMADLAPIDAGCTITENGDGRYKVTNYWGDLKAIVSKESFDAMEKEPDPEMDIDKPTKPTQP